MAKKEVIKIGYPGSVISVNHYQGRRRGGGTYTKPEAQAWMTELGWVAKILHLDDWKLPLHITCDGFFRDERSAPDVHNLLKVIADAIQEVSGINDKNYHMTAGKRVIGVKEHPYLLITIRELAQSPPFTSNKSTLEGIEVKSRVRLPKRKKEG